jgi:hypothetical protein
MYLDEAFFLGLVQNTGPIFLAVPLEVGADYHPATWVPGGLRFGCG